MRPRHGARGRTALALALGLALSAVAAQAAIPSASRITRAVADANRVSARGVPLLLDVELQVEPGVTAAEGELAVHPSGLARLELRNRWGFTERHLLQGSAYQASRDGELLDNPHPFLPPVFLLQARSGEGLSAALQSFGIASGEVVLGMFGPYDCYVFGGRHRGPGGDRELPSLWVDIESFDPVRIVGLDGVEYRFGPIQVLSGIRLPKWIELRARGGFRARLLVRGASRAEAPAALFQPRWLTAESAQD